MVVNSRVAVSVMAHAPTRVRGPRCGNRHSARSGPRRTTSTSSPGRTGPRAHHLGAQPAQPARLALGPVDEGQRVLAEAGDELAAAGVRLVGHHDHRAVGPADVELAPGGQVVVGQVEVDEHLVAGELLALGVLGAGTPPGGGSSG